MKTDFPAVPRNPQSNFINLRMEDIKPESTSEFCEHEPDFSRHHQGIANKSRLTFLLTADWTQRSAIVKHGP